MHIHNIMLNNSFAKLLAHIANILADRINFNDKFPDK